MSIYIGFTGSSVLEQVELEITDFDTRGPGLEEISKVMAKAATTGEALRFPWGDTWTVINPALYPLIQVSAHPFEASASIPVEIEQWRQSCLRLLEADV